MATDAGAILLDCGPGVAAGVRARVQSGQIAAVVLSHMHVDHCLDVLVLGKARLAEQVWGGSGPADPLPLWVPPGGESILRALNALFPLAPTASDPSPVDRVFDLAFTTREYVPGQVLDMPAFRVTPVAVSHAVPACGLRVHDGADTLAYSGDTGMTPALVELADDADVFLCEATFRETPESDHGHLTARQAGVVAAAAGVGTLVLTHLVDDAPAWTTGLVADATASFDGPVHVARPGDHVPVGRDPDPARAVTALTSRLAQRTQPAPTCAPRRTGRDI